MKKYLLAATIAATLITTAHASEIEESFGSRLMSMFCCGKPREVAVRALPSSEPPFKMDPVLYKTLFSFVGTPFPFGTVSINLLGPNGGQYNILSVKEDTPWVKCRNLSRGNQDITMLDSTKIVALSFATPFIPLSSVEVPVHNLGDEKAA